MRCYYRYAPCRIEVISVSVRLEKGVCVYVYRERERRVIVFGPNLVGEYTPRYICLEWIVLAPLQSEEQRGHDETGEN